MMMMHVSFATCNLFEVFVTFILHRDVCRFLALTARGWDFPAEAPSSRPRPQWNIYPLCQNLCLSMYSQKEAVFRPKSAARVFFSGRETQATDKISIKIMLLPRWLKVFFTNLKASASAESKSDGFLHHVGIWDEWIHREFKQTHMNSPCELGIFMVFR